MSGGFFEYQNCRLSDIAETLRLEIAKCRKGFEYSVWSESFLNEMIKAYNMTRELGVILHCIDLVVSRDSGEDDFLTNTAENMQKIEYDNPDKDDDWLVHYKDDD